MMIAQIERDDEDFKTYKISALDFKSLIDGKNANPNKQISDITQKIMERVLHIPLDHGGWYKTHFISSAEYEPMNGCLKLKFDPDLKPYLLDIKSRFTHFDIRYAVRFRSIYSIRLYEMLKQFYDSNSQSGHKIIDIDELKYLFQVDGSYTKYKDFKKRVILQAEKELREKADIYFTFDEIKEGRKVVRLKFNIFRNDKVLDSGQLELFATDELQVKLNGLSDERLQLYHALLEFDLGHDKALRYARDKRVEVLESAIESTKGQAKSEQGFTHSANQFITYLLEKDAVSGKSTYERKQEEEKERVKQERERIFKARKEGNRLYKLFQQEIDRQIDELVENVSEEDKKAVIDSMEEHEKRVSMKNGKINTGAIFFQMKLARMKGVSSKPEKFIEWAANTHSVKVEPYKLTRSEEVRYQGRLDNEGWVITN
jgi:uncharacterized protein YfbU (UPF0304 family)